MKKSAKPYYTICVPTNKNVATGNVCVNLNDVLKHDKDFLFEQEVDGIQYSKVLPKEWVLKNMHAMHATKINEDTGKRTVFPFYVLKIESILSL